MMTIGCVAPPPVFDDAEPEVAAVVEPETEPPVFEGNHSPPFCPH
jgi:hypothetical protein